MQTTIALGRIAGIPLWVHWSAPIGVVLLGQLVALTVLPPLVPGLDANVYWLAGGLAALGAVGSVLAHEVAHAIIARRTGLGVQRITLSLRGGMSELAQRPSGPGTEIRIALIGPVTSLGLAGLFGAATVMAGNLGAPAVVLATLSWLARINVLLGVYNLLPETPLDGSHLLHGLLWRHTRDRDSATRATTAAGQFLGFVFKGLASKRSGGCDNHA